MSLTGMHDILLLFFLFIILFLLRNIHTHIHLQRKKVEEEIIKYEIDNNDTYEHEKNTYIELY